MCADGNGAVGCGEQEEFRGCSDIAVGKGAASAIPTIKPPTKAPPTAGGWPTDGTNVHENEIEHDHDHDHNNHDEPSETDEDSQKPAPPANFFGAIIAMFTFFLVLCVFVAIYVYFYHGDILKGFLRRQNHQTAPFVESSNCSVISSVSSSSPEPPMRPPRSKRLGQNLIDTHNDHINLRESNDKHVSEA
jgi:hypothetical protein